MAFVHVDPAFRHHAGNDFNEKQKTKIKNGKDQIFVVAEIRIR